jgi:Spy/CpxP family protein refolding chaperone
MKRGLVLLLVFSLAVNLTAIVTFSYYWWDEAHSDKGLGRRGTARSADVRPELLRRRLDLSKEQLEQIDGERDRMMTDMMSLREQSSEMRRDLMALLEAEKLDREKADSLLGEIASLQVRIEKQVFEHLVEMKDVLTPEQQRLLLQMLERRLYPGEPERHPLEGRPEGTMRGHAREGGKRGGGNGE